MSARDNILKRLRTGNAPFTDVDPVTERHVVVPMDGVDLLESFVEQATALSAHLHHADDEQSALDYVQQVIGGDKTILAWDFAHIPLPMLADHLAQSSISVADPRDGTVRVGITGVEAALAATGSLVISAKDGKPRSVSLLPYVHIAVLRKDQILPHFDAWIDQQSQDTGAFRAIGNHVMITGASRTADIGMELVLGAHGPAELHIVIL